jgi:hypothetical protein
MSPRKDGVVLPWNEIKIAAIGLGASCGVTVIVSIVGYVLAARRRTLGQSVVVWFGNLFVIGVLSVGVPVVVCAIWAPEGFFSSLVGWIALIVVVAAGFFVNWKIAAVIGMMGMTGQAMAGILADDYEPGPDPHAPHEDALFHGGHERVEQGAPFAFADPKSASVIAGKWDLVEFKAGTGKVEDALDIAEELIRDGGDPQRRRLAELVDSGRFPSLAESSRARALLGRDEPDQS